MPHLDPDRLVLLALGEESLEPADSDHLADCPTCLSDLSATRTVAELGRQSPQLHDLAQPPKELWDRIAAEALGREPGSDIAREPIRPVTRIPRPAGGLRLVLVAAAALAVGVFGTMGANWLTGRDGGRVIAEADLVATSSAPAGAHGKAEILDTGHGLQLLITMSGMPTPSGYYAAWLYDGGKVMIPVGSPGSTPLNLPSAADNLDVYRIVDVSAQQLGQQQHGQSMLQGTLRS